MTSRKRVLITGAIASAVIGGTATLLSRTGPTAHWVFFGLAAALAVNVLITVVGERSLRGRRYIHALAVGNLIGGFVIILIPSPQPPLQLGLGLVSALAGFLALHKWTADAGQAENDRQRRYLDSDIFDVMGPDEREAVHGLSTVYGEAADHRAPILTTLWLNNQFTDIYTTITQPRRVPFRDIALRPQRIEQWRDLALITRALDAPNPRSLRDHLNRIIALPRPLDLSARVLTEAGGKAGLALLESDMPDEYLKALSI